MTIERQWVEIMKQEAPDAFTDELPHAIDVAFIDAQIKLMAMPSQNSWSEFMHKQFRFPICYLQSLGATTIVLAFDDYSHVPRAKSITQRHRVERVIPISFEAHDELPDTPPTPWNAAMANRTFKMKVIRHVIAELPSLLCSCLDDGHKVIVDYDGTSCSVLEKTADGISISQIDREPVRNVVKLHVERFYNTIYIVSTLQFTKTL